MPASPIGCGPNGFMRVQVSLAKWNVQVVRLKSPLPQAKAPLKTNIRSAFGMYSIPSYGWRLLGWVKFVTDSMHPMLGIDLDTQSCVPGVQLYGAAGSPGSVMRVTVSMSRFKALSSLP